MKAAVLALLCLLVVVSAADDHHTHPADHGHNTNHDASHHVPNSSHHHGHDYHCKAHALNETDKAKILKAINTLRDQTAGGHNGHFPKAANMKQIRWDHLLEDEAHRWAANCSSFNSPHNRRRENRTHTIKELIFISVGCHVYHDAHWETAFHHWASGNKTAPIALVHNYTYSSHRKDAERAFSLLNWADTDLVGCGFANLESLSHNPVHKQFIICHFAEGGNKLGHPVYIPGEPASKCPAHFQKSATYHNLCENHTHVEPPKDPFDNKTTTENANETVVQRCTSHELSADVKKQLVDAINKERSTIATGGYLTNKNPNFRKDGFPKAGNMRAIVWDDKLALKARESATTCKATPADKKAKLNVSEILFAQSSLNPFTNVPQWKNATAYWISRKDSVKQDWLSKFDFGTSVADKEAATYTQLIWADSWDVGCAFANQEDTWTSKVTKKVTRALHIQWIICYFTNPGDIKGKEVYIAADPCSKCPSDFHTCSASEGLCHKTTH